MSTETEKTQETDTQEKKNLELGEELENEDSAEVDESEDTESEEKDANSDDESESDEDSEKEDSSEIGKLKKSFQKRVDKLVAKVKTKDEQLEEAREAAQYFRTQLENRQGEFLSDLPEYTYRGRSIYQMSETEIDAAVEEILSGSLPNDQKRKNIKILTGSHAAMTDRIMRAEAALSSEEQKINDYEWSQVEVALLEDVPELKPHIQAISRWIKLQIEQKPYLKAKEAQGKLGKYDLVVKAINALQLNEKLDVPGKRPELKAPVAKKAGSQSAKGGQSKPTFTREQIRKMSPEQYQKNKEAIKLAQKEGRVI